MAESVQRMLIRRALEGHHVYDVEILKDWRSSTIEGWNRHRTPFIWGGKRHARRDLAYARRHRRGAPELPTINGCRQAFRPCAIPDGAAMPILHSTNPYTHGVNLHRTLR